MAPLVPPKVIFSCEGALAYRALETSLLAGRCLEHGRSVTHLAMVKPHMPVSILLVRKSYRRQITRDRTSERPVMAGVVVITCLRAVIPDVKEATEGSLAFKEIGPVVVFDGIGVNGAVGGHKMFLEAGPINTEGIIDLANADSITAIEITLLVSEDVVPNFAEVFMELFREALESVYWILF